MKFASVTLLVTALLCAATMSHARSSDQSHVSHAVARSTDTAEAEVIRVVAADRGDMMHSVARLIERPIRGKGGRVWCVPFARALSGIELKGNASTWWQKAAGQYARGHVPVVGSVLAFRGVKKMPMGHVGVVSGVVSPREILVTHANWVRNRVSVDNRVIDVSPNNDWTQVSVENAGGTLGSAYPAHGFIYQVASR